MTDTKKPREFWVCEVWDPVICTRHTFDSLNDDKLNELAKKHSFEAIKVREVINGVSCPFCNELDAEMAHRVVKYKSLCEELAAALQYYAECVENLRVTSHRPSSKLAREALAKYRKAIE